MGPASALVVSTYRAAVTIESGPRPDLACDSIALHGVDRCARPGGGFGSSTARPPLITGLIAASGVALLAVVDPTSTHVPLCPWKAATALDCPFCGSLRAVHAATRGDLVGAADHNLLLVLGAPLLVLAWLRWLRRGTEGHEDGPFGGLWVPRWATWTAVLVLGVFMVVRNLPIGAWLAST